MCETIGTQGKMDFFFLKKHKENSKNNHFFRKRTNQAKNERKHQKASKKLSAF